MIEKRTINNVFNICKGFKYNPKSLQIAFLEMALNCDNQKFYPEEQQHRDKLSRIVTKVRKQLDVF